MSPNPSAHIERSMSVASHLNDRQPATLPPLRQAISDATLLPEGQVVAALLAAATFPQDLRLNAKATARQLVEQARRSNPAATRRNLVQGLLQEYGLSLAEGIALMCLAEAFLRIPDAATRDALIRDKLARQQWGRHVGKSASTLVNTATLGLVLTGQLTNVDAASTAQTLKRLTYRLTAPLIRRAVGLGMRVLGQQFVMGETIDAALVRARAMEAKGFRYSDDMLGEAALTAKDAATYKQAYLDAIHAIGRQADGRGVHEGPGISIKLSALHPRYDRTQRARVLTELAPDLLELAELAKHYDIGLNIDAEEAERLDISLDLLEQLCQAPTLAGWQGLGFVVQAYQKRCPYVIDHIIDLAKHHQRRLMVRLVKGAYWDSEIKRAQLAGLADYPVFTQKTHTDLSYLVCAQKLLAASEQIYPQFATHNALTVAMVEQLAGAVNRAHDTYEFQCLHGMGDALYDQVPPNATNIARPCRVYAPVGTHETLLAYLVRRLLENGANSSFVNQLANPMVAIDQLLQDPFTLIEAQGGHGAAHAGIPQPPKLYGAKRPNAAGLDLRNELALAALSDQLDTLKTTVWSAGPLLAAPLVVDSITAVTDVYNPADRAELVGQLRHATLAEAEHALALAHSDISWAATPLARRADMLDQAAQLLQQQRPMLLSLLMREAGKTCFNALSELREAVDFLHYYAAQLRSGLLDPTDAPPTPLGVVLCISPWNFPLAIFTGQIVAALAAGNKVLAKPAEPTGLIAAETVKLLWQAGIPKTALQLLPGSGATLGAQLVGDARVEGVLFTGSTAVARLIQRQLAQRLDSRGRPVTFIAETGGQNAMIVDSSALLEQVVGDILTSAFDSAGQRCSALRVLCVQEEVAPALLTMLQGAMAQLQLGNPAALATDIGPIIDPTALQRLEAHVAAMQQRGLRVVPLGQLSAPDQQHGLFIQPTLITLNQLDDLQGEVFGPILHVITFKQGGLLPLIDQINATGYGLTFGLHTRLDSVIEAVVARAKAGNIYVNRNMVGAVVGVQPFGGEGLSGTGPKAGGPLYLSRLLAEAPADMLTVAATFAGDSQQLTPRRLANAEALEVMQIWAKANGYPAVAARAIAYQSAPPLLFDSLLTGPTGEENRYQLLPRQSVLSLAVREEDRLMQLAALLNLGCSVLWPIEAKPLLQRLPALVQAAITLVTDWQHAEVELGAVVLHGDAAARLSTAQALAKRDGAIIPLITLDQESSGLPLERLVIERAISTNTAAAGGNASLMVLG